MLNIKWLLLAIPVSWVAHFMHMEVVVFIASTVAILPIAQIIGHATEELALHSGPRVGGFLNATFGNAAELVIATFLILEGELEVVKASLTGSIIGNVLLVLGAALLVGGVRHHDQTFPPQAAGLHSTSLLLAVVGLYMPALFLQTHPKATFAQVESLSIGVAIILMLLYVGMLVFSFVTHQDALGVHHPAKPNWTRKKAMVVLTAATVMVAVQSELLVSSLEAATKSLGISKFFVGLILVPVVGNAAEHASAVIFAARNKVDIAIEIAAGSSTQVALFVAPLLVFISLLAGNPMNFIFTGFEIAAVGFSTAIVAVISLDGKTNWLEGVQLLGAYLIMAMAAFFI